METARIKNTGISSPNIHEKLETKELKLLSESDFFKYLPEKTKRKINQVLSASERQVK